MAVKLESRPYQSRIVSKLLTSITKEKCSSALIHSPTGSGKTVIAYMILQAILEAGLIKRKAGVRIGWSAMRRHLLAQAAAETSSLVLGWTLTTGQCLTKTRPS
jgi:superfamily II DNA or RNA helicase